MLIYWSISVWKLKNNNGGENPFHLYINYKDFTNSKILNIKNYYTYKFKSFENRGILKNHDSQNYLKFIRNIPIFWYELAFIQLEQNKKINNEHINNILINDYSHYLEFFDNLINFNQNKF